MLEILGICIELFAPLGDTGLTARRQLRKLNLHVLRALLTALNEGNHVHAISAVEMSNVMEE